MIFQSFLLVFRAFMPVLLILPIITVFFIFLVKFHKTHQKMLLYLAILFIFYLTSNIFQVGQFFDGDQQTAENFYVIAEITEVLILFVLMLVFEMFYKNTQFSYRQTILTIFAFTIIGGLISNPELQTLVTPRGFVVELQRFSPLMIIELIFNGTATVFLLGILIHSKKTATVMKQKHLIILLIVGSLIGVLLPSIPHMPLEELVIFSNISPIIRQFLENITQNIGILIIGISFLRVSKNPWLLQRQKVHFLVVYSPSGLTLFSKVFSKEIEKDDTYLLSGAFSAVTTLIKGCTKSTGNVESILLEGKELRIINREKFICALLLDYSTQASDWAHEHFSLEFEKSFSNELKDFDGRISVYESAETLINQFFT